MKDSKIINVTKASLPPLSEFEDMLSDIWDSAWLTNMGKYHEALREQLAAYLGVPEVQLFVNGHSALELLLQALLVEKDGVSSYKEDGRDKRGELPGEVITTPFSFASTTHAIVRNGLKPVFCDINERDYTLDPEKLEALITERTCAILPVHVYGNLCDDDRIQEIAARHHLPVIYDAAHAFGETFSGRGVGTLGTASMFSFHATKVFNTIEGGAVTTGERNDALMQKLYELKNFGILGQEEVASVGANGKMNEFAAAMGLCNLRHVSEYIEKRRVIDQRYRERLSGQEGILLCAQDPRVSYNYAYMPVRFHGFRADRDQVYARLAEQNIHARKYFYPCINAYACYQDRYRAEDTPVAKAVSEEILTLPIYPDLSLMDVDRICDIILRD